MLINITINAYKNKYFYFLKKNNKSTILIIHSILKICYTNK